MVRRAYLIANSKSGKGKGSSLAEEAKSICDELGYELIDCSPKSPDEFQKQSRMAVEKAEADGGIVIAAGGDGTIRGVAQEAARRSVRFACVPCGTFNFFARTHGIPEDHLEAFRLALTGEAKPVRLGEVNGHIFLINASLGLYAKAIRERENRTARYGRNRLVVILSTIMSMLSKHSLLKVDLVTEKKVSTLWTPMIFIGNNALQLRDLKMKIVDCMKSQRMAIVMMKPVTKYEALMIVLHGIFRTLEQDENIDTSCVDSLTIYTRKPSQMIALDGEIVHVQSPLKIEALPGALNLIVPPEKATAT